MVSVPPTMSAGGKRVRRFFTSKREAERFGAGVREAHAKGHRALLTRELADDAVRAARLLEPLGLSLTEAARMAAEVARKDGDPQEIFGDRWRRAVREGEQRWSPRYAADMEKLPRWVGREVMATACGMLTEKVLETAVRDHGGRADTTVHARMLRVLAVLRWKKRRAPGKNGEIAILTPAECGRVLRACHGAEERRTVALLMFAGIRPDTRHGEISKLRWEDVGPAEIYVSPKVSKAGDRHVPVTPRLARLLRGHPAEGPVAPPRWPGRWQRIRREAGISHLQDVLRHTFASNALAAWGEDETKQAMGHTRGSHTLFRHYRRAVTREAGLAFFS